MPPEKPEERTTRITQKHDPNFPITHASFQVSAAPERGETMTYEGQELCEHCGQPVPYGCSERGCQGDYSWVKPASPHPESPRPTKESMREMVAKAVRSWADGYQRDALSSCLRKESAAERALLSAIDTILDEREQMEMDKEDVVRDFIAPRTKEIVRLRAEVERLQSHLDTPPSPTTNYEAQEEVVAALYEFNTAQQQRPHNTRYGSPERGSLNLAAVGEALTRIMKTFGYEVQRVD